MKSFHIPGHIARELIEHAQAEYPKECCGFIIGPPGQAAEVRRLRNVDPDPVMRYLADSDEVKRVNDEIWERDWDVVSVYHSHTHSPAYPSQTDVTRAVYPDAAYVLVGLKDRGNPELRAFHILSEEVRELDVVTVDEVTK